MRFQNFQVFLFIYFKQVLFSSTIGSGHMYIDVYVCDFRRNKHESFSFVKRFAFCALSSKLKKKKIKNNGSVKNLSSSLKRTLKTYR